MRTFINILTAMLIVMGTMSAQQVGTQCTSTKFEQKIDSYLQYSVNTITVKDAARHQENYVFLDAREPEEYDISHIPDARLVGYDDFDLSALEGVQKDTPIVIYCSIGYRSEVVGEKLQKAGYTNVNNLYGSIFEWANQGLPLLDKGQQATHKVHTYNKKWSKWVINEAIEKVW